MYVECSILATRTRPTVAYVSRRLKVQADRKDFLEVSRTHSEVLHAQHDKASHHPKIVTRSSLLRATVLTASSSSIFPREANAFGPLDFGISKKDADESEAKPVAAQAAVAALLSGREALVQVMRFPGSEGGMRARLRNLMPRYSSTVQTMVALLPAAVMEGVAADDVENVLVGSSNVIALATYIREDKPFEDSDIPEETFSTALRSIDAILGQVDDETIALAQRERCFALLNAAVDYQEMKSLSQTAPACQVL